MSASKAPRLASFIPLVLAVVTSPVLAQAPSTGIRVQLAVEPASVTVGQPFYTALRVSPPTGYTVEYGEIVADDTLQAVEPVRLTTNGDSVSTAIYALVAWVAGIPLARSVDVRFTGPDGVVRSQSVRLQLPEIASVLPAEAEVIEPRPPKELIDAGLMGRLPWWWWLLLLLGTLLAAWLGYWLLKRRPEDEPAVDPREWALTQLDRGAGALLHAGALEAVFQRVSWIIRTYIYRVRPELGPDLTTTELLDRLQADEADAALIQRLALQLLAADRVKFARHQPSAAEATEIIAEARSWVLAFPAATQPDADSREAA